MQLDIAADPKRLCRICMAGANEHFVDLYDAASFGLPSLHGMLRTICAPVFAKPEAEDVVVMPQMMPTKVCLECRNATVAAYDLHQQCIEADRRLGELIALMWELQSPGGDEIGDDCVEQAKYDEPCAAPELPATPQEQTQKEEMVDSDSLLMEEVLNRDEKCSECGISFSSFIAHRKHTQEGNCRRTHTYPCRICGKVFDKQTRLQYHMYSHKERVACEWCDETFRNRGGLLVHINRKRCPGKKSQEEPTSSAEVQEQDEDAAIDMQCKECGVSFTSSKAQRTHIQEGNCQQRPTFPCTICGKTFDKLSRMQYHLYTHRERFPCPRCVQTFRYKTHLRRHLANKSCKVMKASISQDVDTSQEPEEHDTSEDPLLASEIKVEEPEIEDAETELESEVFAEQIVVPEEGHNIDESCLQESEQSPKPFACDLCEKSFTSVVGLVHHKNKHVDRGYCDKCRKLFKSKADLETHIARGICLGDMARTCLVCKKLFETMVEYRKHRREAHQGPIDCTDCGRTLRNFHSFYVHVRERYCKNIKNRSSKGGKCKICGEVQASIPQLKLHMKAKHLGKIFHCAACQLHFPTQQKFDAHTEKHAQKLVNICQTCNTSFPTLAALKRHKFTHMKPVKCAVCGRAFSSKYHLKVHMSHTHTGENPHACELCPVRFRTVAGKQKHMRTYSSEPSDEQQQQQRAEEVGGDSE
uniref:Zinc finger protein 26 n=1 Tax=Culex pipiens TaxID=7175 RepID=A0A8D8ACK3_CULPI